MRLLYLTRAYTAHDARWLRILAGLGYQLGFLPLRSADEVAFRRSHAAVDLLASPGVGADANTADLDAVKTQVEFEIRT